MEMPGSEVSAGQGTGGWLPWLRWAKGLGRMRCAVYRNRQPSRGRALEKWASWFGLASPAGSESFWAGHQAHWVGGRPSVTWYVCAGVWTLHPGLNPQLGNPSCPYLGLAPWSGPGIIPKRTAPPVHCLSTVLGMLLLTW